MLESLRADVNSVKLNQDYVFYPRTSTVSSTTGLQPVVDYPAVVSGSVSSTGLPVSMGAAASTLLTARSSQSSSNLPSVVSHSVSNQTVPTSVYSTAAGVGMTPNVRPIPGMIPASGSSVFFDGNAALTNLEEVLPIDRIGHLNTGMPQNLPIDESGLLRGSSYGGAVVDGVLGTVETGELHLLDNCVNHCIYVCTIYIYIVISF